MAQRMSCKTSSPSSLWDETRAVPPDISLLDCSMQIRIRSTFVQVQQDDDFLVGRANRIAQTNVSRESEKVASLDLSRLETTTRATNDTTTSHSRRKTPSPHPPSTHSSFRSVREDNSFLQLDEEFAQLMNESRVEIFVSRSDEGSADGEKNFLQSREKNCSISSACSLNQRRREQSRSIF